MIDKAELMPIGYSIRLAEIAEAQSRSSVENQAEHPIDVSGSRVRPRLQNSST
jgi:hypothetical protein